jgi:hypothetical protein
MQANLKKLLEERLEDIRQRLNAVLRGEDLTKIQAVLSRLGRGGRLPYWFEPLAQHGSLPNLDGKTIGSVVEMLFVAVIETHVIPEDGRIQLKINPARGVDLPDLQLGVKSPSKNFCTSEPFYSAYERLLGSDYDVVVLLTDYQAAKKTPPLKLQVTDARYLRCTQIADKNICSIARRHRGWLMDGNEANAKRLFKFLAYVNQSDWLGKKIVDLVKALDDEKKIRSLIERAGADFYKVNKSREKRCIDPVAEVDLLLLQKIMEVSPIYIGVLQAADDWVMNNWKEMGRAPNDNEWKRLSTGPLNGEIGMSFALQWRYNFGQLFSKKASKRGAK